MGIAIALFLAGLVLLCAISYGVAVFISRFRDRNGLGL